MLFESKNLIGNDILFSLYWQLEIEKLCFHRGYNVEDYNNSVQQFLVLLTKCNP